MPERDDVAFERTWAQLALPPDRTAGIALDATITTRTLAALRPTGAEPAPTAAGSLPHISVHDVVASAPAPAASGPDLVIVGLLGEGGMGRVELARQRSLEREVALKRPRAGASELDASAVCQEGLITGSLEHPSIIPIHALGRDDAGRPLIIMKRVDGVSWRELIHQDDHAAWQRLEPSPAARLTWHLSTLVQVANAAAFAHSRGVLHRDIKPDNVMIGDFGEVYLLDWGLAVRASDAARGTLVGTPAYMAPEMVDGGQLDDRTDVYLLGATLHEILTRQVRHPGGDLEAVLRAAFASRPFAYGADVSSELAALANRATACDPADRPPSALAFRQALADCIRHRGSIALAGEAEQRIEAVERDLTVAAVDATDRTRLDRGLDECRFAYRQALREWSENRVALAGLERCAVATARLEIARGNASAARAALADVSTPPDDLVTLLTALEAQEAAGEVERERLRSLARDVDPSAGAGARVVTMLIMLLGGTAISIYALAAEKGGRSISRVEFVTFPALLVLGGLVTVFVMRRSLIVNAFSRRLMTWCMVVMIFLLANRGVGMLLGVPIRTQLALDQVFLTALVAAGAIFIFRWLWVCAACTAIGAVVAALDPRLAFIAFCLSSFIAMMIAVVALRRQPRSE